MKRRIFIKLIIKIRSERVSLTYRGLKTPTIITLIVSQSCESGHLPRVVAETIAWLDAHGKQPYWYCTDTVGKRFARDATLFFSSSSIFFPPLPVISSHRTDRVRRLSLPSPIAFAKSHSRRQDDRGFVQSARRSRAHSGVQVAVRPRRSDAAQGVQRRSHRCGCAENVSRFPSRAPPLLPPLRLPPRGAAVLSSRVGFGPGFVLEHLDSSPT